MIDDLLMLHVETSTKLYYTTLILFRNLLNNDCQCTSRHCLHGNNTLRIVKVTKHNIIAIPTLSIAKAKTQGLLLNYNLFS